MSLQISSPSGGAVSLPPAVDTTAAARTGPAAPYTDISANAPTHQPGAAAASQLPSPAQGAPASQTLAAFNMLTPDTMQADMYAVMALMTKTAQQQRTAAREQRHTEMQSQYQAQMDAAQQIREAANDRLMGAILSGVMNIAAGAMQIGGAAKSLSTSGSAFKTKLEADKAVGIKPGVEPTPGQQSQLKANDTAFGYAAAKANAATSGADGASKMLGGFGGVASGVMEQQAAQHDARKAELEAKSRLHETAMQQAGDVMQQMQDMLRDIRDKLSSMEQSRIETTRGIARNI